MEKRVKALRSRGPLGIMAGNSALGKAAAGGDGTQTDAVQQGFELGFTVDSAQSFLPTPVFAFSA